MREGRIVAEKRPTGTASGTARAARSSRSSRGCRCSGSSRSGRWPRRRATRCASGRRRRPPAGAGASATSTGSTTCTTGASPGSCGGATGSRSGTGRTARCVCVGPDEEPPAARAGRQDPDVLDTWFSSGAVAVLHAGLAGADRATSRSSTRRRVLVTGYDILFFWVARMMMFGLYAMDGVAARSTRSRCTAWSATSTARRCRSPVGNVGRPAASWMDVYGADATAVHAGPRRQPGRRRADRRRSGSPASRNFCTKLWNATRFALANGADRARRAAAPTASSTDADRWILGRLARGHRRRSTRCSRTSSSPRPPRRSTTSRGTSCATGTWSWPSRSSPWATGEPPTAPGAVLGHVLDVLLRLLHPIVAVRHRGAVDGAHRGRVGGHRGVARRADRRGVPVDAGGGRRGSPTLQTLVTEIRRFRTEQRVPDQAAGRGPARPGSTRPGSRRDHEGRSASLVPAGRAGRRSSRRRPPLEVALAGGPVVVELDTSRGDRRRRRADPAGPRSRRRAEGARPGREEAGQPRVRGEGPRPRRRGHPGQAGEGGRGPRADHGAVGGVAVMTGPRARASSPSPRTR